MQRKKASGSGKAVEQRLSKFTHNFLKSTGKSVGFLAIHTVYGHGV